MIKNIVFDLGGVLLDLNWQGCVDAFTALGAEDVENIIHKFGSKDVFGDLEHGHIEEHEFYNGLRKMLKRDISDDQLRDAWNVIIHDFPVHRIAMLQKLKKDYKLYVLSNTSIIHTKHYEKMLVDSIGMDMETLFDGIVYSYEVGLSKPSPGIYKNLIEKTGINPAESVFIDDAAANTAEALKHGLNVIHKPDTIEVADFDFSNLENNPKFVSAF